MQPFFYFFYVFYLPPPRAAQLDVLLAPMQAVVFGGEHGPCVSSGIKIAKQKGKYHRITVLLCIDHTKTTALVRCIKTGKFSRQKADFSVQPSFAAKRFKITANCARVVEPVGFNFPSLVPLRMP
nr:hypothetical protein [Oscillibacter sp.]